jgi:hypothetical protein
MNSAQNAINPCPSRSTSLRPWLASSFVTQVCGTHYTIFNGIFVLLIIITISVEKAVPYAYPFEQISSRRADFYGELFTLISSEQPGLTPVQAAVRFGKILDVINQLMVKQKNWQK